LRCLLMHLSQYGTGRQRGGDYGSGCTTHHHHCPPNRRVSSVF